MVLVVQKGRTNMHDEKQNGQVTIHSRKCSRILLAVLTLHKALSLFSPSHEIFVRPESEE